MKAATERKIIRWLHIVASIPIVGYIYGPVKDIPNAVMMIKWVLFPLIVFSGLSVAVVQNNVMIYTHSFGMKDLESSQPLTDDCIFRIASISKSFSATSIMQLVQRKKLSLDDDMSNLMGFPIRHPKYPQTV